jgi:hypothetical protein
MSARNTLTPKQRRRARKHHHRDLNRRWAELRPTIRERTGPTAGRTALVSAKWDERVNVAERVWRALTPAQRDAFEVLLPDWTGTLTQVFETVRRVA